MMLNITDNDDVIEKLSMILDTSQATTFAEKLYSVYDEFRASTTREKGRKRKVRKYVIYTVRYVNKLCSSHSEVRKYFIKTVRYVNYLHGEVRKYGIYTVVFR